MSRDLQGFEGTGSLLRLSFRRDRIRIPIWISLLVTIVYVSSRAVADIYPTQASRLAAANAINDSSALLAMFGRIYDPTSIGAIGLVKLIAFGAAGVAVLSGLITIRHSRAEEESGRLDLIGAAVVGRKSALTAALLTSVVTSIALGFMASLALMAADLPVSGSLAFGAAWAGAGIAFAGIAAIAAQISRSSRGATGLLAGSIGVAYLLRALGDSTQRIGWLTWVTPLGWVHHIQPFASEKWWVLALLFGFSVITTGVAFALAARRDLGSGLLADMPGPEEAGTALSTPLALAWRLERTSFIAWTAAFVVLGSVVGGVAGNVGEFLNTETGRQMMELLGGEKGLVNAYLAAELSFVGIFIAAYGVHVVLRLKSEETLQRAELLFSYGVTRMRWAASQIAVAFVGTVVLAASAGVSAGIARAYQTRESADFIAILGGALIQLPAAWVVIGLCVVGYGLSARLANLGWSALVLFLLITEVGALLKLPHGVIDLSPFSHTPKLPGSPVSIEAVVILVVTGASLVALGLGLLSRRDIG